MNLFNTKDVNCEIFYPNIQSVSEEEYALIRRKGLGASDASVYMGLMAKFDKDIPGLIVEKLRTTISDEEREIGMKESVRKGKDLEDLILTKFSQLHQCDKPIKPPHMYQVKDFPYLTVNFDGVLFENEQYVPVECKFVTRYGDKYYNRKFAYEREFGDCQTQGSALYKYADTVGMCEAFAEKIGIPAYYYVQVQQQMLALGSTYGYLTALHDKDWELVIYRVPRNDDVIRSIQVKGYQVWQQIETKRKRA